MGVTLDEANPEEFYRAFALTLREEIMINWTACDAHLQEKKGAHALLPVHGVHAGAIFGQ